MKSEKSAHLVEHFFRHEYGRLVSSLSHRVGVQHIEAVEDAVQAALMRALEAWTHVPQIGSHAAGAQVPQIGSHAAGAQVPHSLPDNPSAWLARVAHNHLVDALRAESGRKRILAKDSMPAPPAPTPQAFVEGELSDDLLRMLFVCCDEAIPVESQLVLALKTLCGFSVREISHRLFATEATIYKRLGRARARLREQPPQLDLGDRQTLGSRRPGLHKILYLLFTEGYLSSHAELAIRRELCDEALRLATLLVQHPVGQDPQSFALLALMHLHAARMSARQDHAGGLLLLEEQDRSQWDPQQIRQGLHWLARSAQGETFSRYHGEAGIAAEHCLAPSFAETNWQRVAECYALLEKTAPSALHRLNRAVAVAQWQGPAEGLAVLGGFVPPTWLTGSHLWAAVQADLHRRCGNLDQSQRHTETALKLAPTEAVRELLKRRLQG